MVYAFGISHWEGETGGNGQSLLVGAIAGGAAAACVPRRCRPSPDPTTWPGDRAGTGSESWEWLDALAGDVDEDFVSAVREQPEATERPGLGKVFR
jgi:hypothetical protein